jgi:hypothetical protein
MADLIAVFTVLVLFPISLLYVRSCDRLKGSRR